MSLASFSHQFIQNKQDRDEVHPSIIAMAKVNQVLLEGEGAEVIVCPAATATPGTCWGMDAKHLVAEQNKDKDPNIILAWLKDEALPSAATLFFDYYV